MERFPTVNSHHVLQTSGGPNIRVIIADAIKALESSSLPGVGTSLRRIRLDRASRLLHAVEYRCCFEELAEVKKQLLIVKCEIISLFQQTDLNKQAVNELYSHIEEALDIWAWQCVHPHAQSLDAVSKFRSTLSFLPDIAYQCSPSVDIFLGIQSLLSKSKVASDPLIIPLRIQVSYPPIEETFHEAIRHFEAGRWAPAMSLLKSQDSAIDVLAGLEDVYASLPQLEEYREDGTVRSWRVDFDMQLAMCRASQLLHTGDWHFKEAETGLAEDLMGRAQLAQDDYRAALLCAAGQDLELEGAALARLARFYAKIVKLAVPAHQLYLRAVQLAASLSPTLPKGDWYKESAAAVQAHRDELQAQEAKEWAARREPILLKLGADIEKLRGGGTMGNRDFCQFVFKEWPPKTDGPTDLPSDPLNPGNFSKKQLLKVIQRYHTDRNSKYGEEWLVLCEEISKELSARYTIMKEGC